MTASRSSQGESDRGSAADFIYCDSCPHRYQPGVSWEAAQQADDVVDRADDLRAPAFSASLRRALRLRTVSMTARTLQNDRIVDIGRAGDSRLDRVDDGLNVSPA